MTINESIPLIAPPTGIVMPKCSRCKVKTLTAPGIIRAQRYNPSESRSTEAKFILVTNAICPVCGDIWRRDILNDAVAWRDSLVR